MSSLKLENETNSFLMESQTSFKCTGCNVTFQKPILATVASRGSVQTYYACPRCLSKVGNVKHDESEKSNAPSISMKNVKKVAVKREDDVKCEHFVGYLKKRSKDVPIPDECLTCDKMIECLVH